MLISFSYIERESFVHGLDPRTKFILLFAYSFTALQTSNIWFILVCFMLAMYYYSRARLKWSETKKSWIFLLTLTTVLVIGNYILSDGAVVQGIELGHQHFLFSVPFLGFTAHPPYIGRMPLAFSVESILFAVTQELRNVSIIALALVIPFTTDPGLMGAAFKGMGVPDKFAYAIDLSFRFLPTVFRDFDTTLDAQRARGFELDKIRGGLISKTMRIAPMVLPVVIGSIIGAEDIISAMELRCFGVGKRSWYIELHPRTVDRILIGAAIGIFVLITVLDIVGGFYDQGIFHILRIQGLPAF